jgi:hypothetical protein
MVGAVPASLLPGFNESVRVVGLARAQSMPYNSPMPTRQLWLLKQVDLWPQEQELCVKATDGGLLDLRSGRPGEDDPSQGRVWGKDRQIRAPVLFQLLTGHGPELTNNVIAVRLRGAYVVGQLNLGGLTLRCPLELYDCHLHWLGVAKWA